MNIQWNCLGAWHRPQTRQMMVSLSGQRNHRKRKLEMLELQCSWRKEFWEGAAFQHYWRSMKVIKLSDPSVPHFYLTHDRLDLPGCSFRQLEEKPDMWQQSLDQGPQCNYGYFNTVDFYVYSCDSILFVWINARSKALAWLNKRRLEELKLWHRSQSWLPSSQCGLLKRIIREFFVFFVRL